MKHRQRIYYTEKDKALMWGRSQKGESLHSIARHFGRGHSSIQGAIGRTGGIRPLPRRRSRLSLTLAEREEISRGISAGHSLRAIATALGRAPSTVSRELTRNSGFGCYRAHAAEQAAWDRAPRPKPCKLALNRPLARTVARLPRRRWSPWQIAGRLRREYPRDESCRVSHETIYKTLFIQARGALKKGLIRYLRRRHSVRRSRHHTQKTTEPPQVYRRLFCVSQAAIA